MESCNTESSLDLPLESLSLQPFLQSLHKEQWQEVRLGEVAEIISGGTPKTSIPEYWNGEIPWLTPKDLAGYNHIYISKGERFITKLGLKNSSATLMPKGTILLSSRAPIGYVAIAQNDICTNQGFKSLIVNPKQACNLFVYYWIKDNVKYLQSLGTGTTFEEISKGVVQDITIPLPPLTIQQKIAEILSSFDDKIDLLHRQNKTLESLALTLFRHYFIDNPKRNEWEEKPLSE
ncbi:restriction endonuclease subunit S, partial [Helicobacter bilis]